MNKKVFLPLLLIALLLAGCGPSEAEIATMTATMWTPTHYQYSHPHANPHVYTHCYVDIHTDGNTHA